VTQSLRQLDCVTRRAQANGGRRAEIYLRTLGLPAGPTGRANANISATTPFHGCSLTRASCAANVVVERKQGIDWQSGLPPSGGQEGLQANVTRICKRLQRARGASVKVPDTEGWN